MTILVVGGAGYIGSHTTRMLMDDGFHVAVIDNFQTGHRQAVPPKAALYEGDLRNGGFLDRVFSQESVDTVIHFAACSLVGENMTNPLKYYDNNIHGTQMLVNAMLRHGVENIVFSSTAAVYGEVADRAIVESDTTIPTNPYGETKLAIEKMFKWVSQAATFRYACLRYFNAAGADVSATIGESHNPETHLIPLVLQVALGKAHEIGVFGDDYNTSDGTCVRDYIHVSDLARAHILAMRHIVNGGESGAFNLGTGTGFSVMQVVEAARSVTGHPIPVAILPRRPGDPAALVASGQKAEGILGFNSRESSLEHIIRTAWEWHSSHPDGFNDIHDYLMSSSY